MKNEKAIIFISETKIEEKNTRKWKKPNFANKKSNKIP
jgi:hypothetical protein